MLMPAVLLLSDLEALKAEEEKSSCRTQSTFNFAEHSCISRSACAVTCNWWMSAPSSWQNTVTAKAGQGRVQTLAVPLVAKRG